MEAVWNKVLSELEIEVSKATFLTLFKGTSLSSIEENVVTVATPSPMVSSLIEKRYYGLIQKILKKCLEKEVSVVFKEQTPVLPHADKENLLPLFSNGDLASDHRRKIARLRMDFTFENFAVSSTNQLAYASATAVAKNLGASYNPLFFYGTVGVGKTHLMHAIGHEVLNLFPDKKVVYLTSEEFTNEFIESIRSKSTPAFRKKFRTARLLLIDDVQFLAGKEKVQEELFHTFNSLVSDEQQVVFSSDRPPTELEKIEKRLKSRFSGGLIVDIAPPDIELRCAILLIKAKRKGIDLPIDLAKVIAENIDDTRRLEGTLNRFITELAHNGSQPSSELVSQILKTKQTTSAQKVVSVEDLVSAVCTFYEVKPTQLKGQKRNRFLTVPRHALMYLLKSELGKTLVEIGNIIGGRDHTTIMYGIEKVEGEINNNPKFHSDIMGIKKLVWG